METKTAEVTDPATKHETNNPRKRVRHRKKQLYENIMKQMEFYFSDANLSKDRFLGDLVKNDPFVPLTEFLKFNKIRSITQEVNDIVKAMKHSTFLELSEDKLKVKRKIPMVPYDADLRTVYVESIPVTASREWLERVFSEFGQVAYISLPKFKNSNKIKGFAFIEFTKPQDAQKCVNSFTEMGSKLPSCLPPEELSSIKMFTIENSKDSDKVPQNLDSKSQNPDTNVQVKEEYEPPKKKAKKRDKKPPKTLDLKQAPDSDSEKKITPTEETKSVTTPSEEGKNTDVEAESKDETSQDEGKPSVRTPTKKKLKKKTAKEKVKPKALAKSEAAKGALFGLQVLPKAEWKALRNKYLNLQRKYMREVKMSLRSNRHAYSGIPDPAAPAMEVEPVKYSAQTAESTKTAEPLPQIPGVFVKEVLSEPCLDLRLTKKTIKSNIHALHVHAKEGQSEVIIRFDSSKAADEYCANSNNRARVLCGAEEQEQWRLAESARANKRARGRDRLLARAAAASGPPALAPASPQPTHTHIRFDDE